jgi:HlyD family secretion protein
MFPNPVRENRPAMDRVQSARKWSKWVIGAVLLISAAALALRYFPHSSRLTSIDPRHITLATVVQGTFERDIAGESVVGAQRRQTIAAAWNGVVSFRVRTGDLIQPGQLLATIDSPNLENTLLQERAQLEALVTDEKRAEVEERKQREMNRQNYRLATVDEEAASRELLRERQAYEKGAFPEIDVLRAQDTLRRTQIQVERAQSSLRFDSTRLTLEARSRALAREKQALLVKELEREKGQLSIRSAMSGQVAQILVADHSVVSRDAPMIGLVDPKDVELDLRIPQNAAADVQLGATADVTAAAENYEARVVEVSSESVGGMVLIKLQFNGARPSGLRQGQRLSTRLVLERHTNVLKVQRGPFVEESGGEFAYVVDGKRAIRRPIHIGAINADEVEITDGLHAGDAVVVAGARDVSRTEINLAP